jgi:small subunit ribosomal protein S18
MAAVDMPTVKRPFFRRAKSCPFSGEGAQEIDWKDPRTLARYITETGKMAPARVSYVSAKAQRRLAQAIKRARFMALMPYVRSEVEDRRGGARGAPSGGRSRFEG